MTDTKASTTATSSQTAKLQDHMPHKTQQERKLFTWISRQKTTNSKVKQKITTQKKLIKWNNRHQKQQIKLTKNQSPNTTANIEKSSIPTQTREQKETYYNMKQKKKQNLKGTNKKQHNQKQQWHMHKSPTTETASKNIEKLTTSGMKNKNHPRQV